MTLRGDGFLSHGFVPLLAAVAALAAIAAASLHVHTLTAGRHRRYVARQSWLVAPSFSGMDYGTLIGL